MAIYDLNQHKLQALSPVPVTHRPALNPGGWGTEQERIRGASGKFEGPPSQTIVKASTSRASSLNFILHPLSSSTSPFLEKQIAPCRASQSQEEL